jgi:hypothetical protein
VAGEWFYPDTPVSSANKTEILLKVALSTINPYYKTHQIQYTIKYTFNDEEIKI